MIQDPIHNSKFNAFVFAGISIHNGFAPDGYVEFQYNTDRTSSVVSAGGKEIAISAIPDRSATITVTLLQQSPENLKLLKLIKMQDAATSAAESVVFSDIDIELGGTLFLYEPKGCHIQSAPSQSIAMDSSGATQSWTFHCAEMKPKDIDDYFAIRFEVKSNIEGEVTGGIQATLFG